MDYPSVSGFQPATSAPDQPLAVAVNRVAAAVDQQLSKGVQLRAAEQPGQDLEGPALGAPAGAGGRPSTSSGSRFRKSQLISGLGRSDPFIHRYPKENEYDLWGQTPTNLHWMPSVSGMIPDCPQEFSPGRLEAGLTPWIGQCRMSYKRRPPGAEGEPMQHQISLREANQHLSRYIRIVERGEELVITRRGKPVARLVAVTTERRLSPEQLAALERTRRRMHRGYDLGGRMPARDELHER